MRLTCVILILLFTKVAFSQEYEGYVLDSLTNDPIIYANIGIVEKNNGTVSTQNGYFKIIISTNSDLDTIRFSFVGYESKSFLVKDFKTRYKATGLKITLVPKVIQLEEVTVISSMNKPIVLGNTPRSRFTSIGLTSNRLGYEIGSLFKNKKSNTTVDSVQLYFAKCSYDSIFLRLNIYKVEKGLMINILKVPIYLNFSKRIALRNPIIDLTKYSIVMDGDFFISVEYVRDLGGRNVWFYATMNSDNNPAMYRETSQAKWKFIYHNSTKSGICILAFIN